MKKIFILILLLLGCKDSGIIPKKKVIEIQIQAIEPNNIIKSRTYKLS